MSRQSAQFICNPRLRFSIFSALVLSCFVASSARAQVSGSASTGTGGNHTIQGKIFFPSGRRAEGVIQVKLQSLNAGEITTIADANGGFTFSSLSPGNYTVVVNAGDEFEISREAVTIDSDLNLTRAGVPLNPSQRRYTVMVTLQPKRDVVNLNKPSVINAALAEVPEAARNLYEKALDLARIGDSAKAVENLKLAIGFYPKFPLALNELGVQYLKLGQANKAVDPLRTATRLNPDAFTPRLNLGIALLETQQLAEAEAELRLALKTNSTPTAHMYLGLTLARLHNDVQAELELKRAVEMGGDQLAIAHYYLGGLYWRLHQYAQAATELDTYLRLTPNAPDAARVRETIKDLRAKVK